MTSEEISEADLSEDESKIPMKSHDYNKLGLQIKFDEMKTPAGFYWIENLDVSSDRFLEADPSDDLAREAEFYEQTLFAVQKGLSKLKNKAIPYRRPSDFFAEMIKPDKHMNRIKDSLIRQRTKMDTVQKRRAAKDASKWASKTKTEDMKQKHKKRREHDDQLKKLKKKTKGSKLNIKKSEFGLVGLENEDDSRWNGRGKGAKRKAKDARYTFKKKDEKKNTSKSSRDDDDGFEQMQNSNFKNRAFKAKFKGKGKFGGKKRFKSQRPGKNKRGKMRQ